MPHEIIVLKYGCGAHWQQPYHRADLQAHDIAIRKVQQVVEESVLRVPHFIMVRAHTVHRIGDPYEVLKEPEGDFLIHVVVIGQNQRDLQHALAVEGHPCSAVCLIEVSAGRQRSTAVEDTDVVQTEKAPRENVAPLRILTIHPPVEIQHQSLE